MKLPRLLLLGSFALNFLLMGLVVWRVERSGDSGPPKNPDAAGAGASGDRGRAQLQCLAIEPAAMQAKLEAMNFPREVVESLVISRIFARYAGRRRELSTAAMKLPWWQTAPAWPARLSLLTAAERKELRELEAAARNEVLKQLGPGALDRDGVISARHAYLPPDRAVLLDAMLRDYEDIEEELKEETQGFRTAADRQKEALVENERQRDLAAMLTTAERDIFDLRTASAAQVVQYRVGTFQPTEAEYRAVVAICKDYEASHPGKTAQLGWMAGAMNIPDNTEHEERIRQALGEARYADWVLAGQGYAMDVAALAPQLNLTAETAKGVAVLLDETLKRSREIGASEATDVAQKHAALAGLAAQTRAEVIVRLGPAGGAALLGKLSWLDLIAKGNMVTVTGHGTSWGPVHRPVPQRPPRAKARPPSP